PERPPTKDPPDPVRKVQPMKCRIAGLVALAAAATVALVGAQEPRVTAPPQPATGILKYVDVPAPALKKSLLPQPDTERAAVYLPPSYDGSQRRFPVVYYLPGFGDQILLYTEVRLYQGFALKESLDRLIGQGRITEMIVVIPNGLTPLGGSFYVNSPLNGAWEDFISTDLVRYVDQNFRTLAGPASRALAGHSMGGFGALNIAMRHPDVFAAVYALAPGLAAPGDLRTHPSFADASVRGQVIALLDALRAQDMCRAEVTLLSQASYLNGVFDTYPLFALAYGAAFAPAQTGDSRLIEYPYHRVGTELVFDELVWDRYERGFGDWDEKVRQHLANLKELASITIDVGERDEHGWIPRGCRYLSQLLRANGVAHELVVFSGGHQDMLRERLEEHMFPTLSRV
ncbi:MAG: alpha/beta fold hydrolase, partial [Thermoanaerobaculia bacterium]|nr:alpha/beta fold hydrolase [Thermoanaerobaculia bacterium]